MGISSITFAFNLLQAIPTTAFVAPASMPHAIALQGGSFAIAANSTHVVSGKTYPSTIAIFDATGTQKLYLYLQGTNPVPAKLSNGAILVATDDVNGVKFRVLSTAGLNITGDRDIGEAASSRPAVTGLPNGGFAIAYRKTIGPTDYDIEVRTFSATGVLQKTFSVAGSGTSQNLGLPAITAMPNGNLGVAWNEYIDVIYVSTRMFSMAGAPLSGVCTQRDAANPSVVPQFSGGYRVDFEQAVTFPPIWHPAEQANMFISATGSCTYTPPNIVNPIISSYQFATANDPGWNAATPFKGANDVVAYASNISGNGDIWLSMGHDHYTGSGDVRVWDNADHEVWPSVAALTNGKVVVAAWDDTNNTIEAKLMKVVRTVQLDNTANPAAFTGDVLSDVVNGGTSADGIAGGAGIDALQGNDGADNLFGDMGDDALSGGAGKDILEGGLGNDLLNGGADVDKFKFASPPTAANSDMISDFAHGSDKIMLSKAIYTKLTVGTLPAAQFVAGTVATNAAQRIIYSRATGDLWYDPDGSGPAVKRPIAQSISKALITAGDITVY